MTAGLEVCEQICRKLEGVLRQALPNASVIEVGYGLREENRQFIAVIQQPGIADSRELERHLLDYIHKCYPKTVGLNLSIQVSE